jgi:transposase
MIMGLSLLIYSLAERKLRQALKLMNATGPDQRREPIQHPAIRWVFQFFKGLDILLVRQNGEVVHRKFLSLRPTQEQIITSFGYQVQKCYLFHS